MSADGERLLLPDGPAAFESLRLDLWKENAAFPPIGSSYGLNTNEVLAAVDLGQQRLGMVSAQRRQRDELDRPEAAACGAGSTGDGLLAEIGAWPHGGAPA